MEDSVRPIGCVRASEEVLTALSIFPSHDRIACGGKDQIIRIFTLSDTPSLVSTLRSCSRLLTSIQLVECPSEWPVDPLTDSPVVLLFASELSPQIHVWNAYSGTLLQVLTQHGRDVNDIAVFRHRPTAPHSEDGDTQDDSDSPEADTDEGEGEGDGESEEEDRNDSDSGSDAEEVLLLASASRDRTIGLWECEEPQAQEDEDKESVARFRFLGSIPSVVGHTGSVVGIAALSDAFVSVAFDRTLRCWIPRIRGEEVPDLSSEPFDASAPAVCSHVAVLPENPRCVDFGLLYDSENAGESSRIAVTGAKTTVGEDSGLFSTLNSSSGGLPGQSNRIRVWRFLETISGADGPGFVGEVHCERAIQGHVQDVVCLKLVVAHLPGEEVPLTLVVSGSRDYTLRVCDVATGKTLHAWEAHEGPVRCLDAYFSQTGPPSVQVGVDEDEDRDCPGLWIASGGDDGMLRIWWVPLGMNPTRAHRRVSDFGSEAKHVLSQASRGLGTQARHLDSLEQTIEDQKVEIRRIKKSIKDVVRDRQRRRQEAVPAVIERADSSSLRRTRVISAVALTAVAVVGLVYWWRRRKQ